MAIQKGKGQDDETGIDNLFSESDLSAAVEQIAAEMGIAANAYVIVHQIQTDGTEGRVWKGEPQDYDLEKIAKTFGSAPYTVRLYVAGESGRYSCRGNKTFKMILDPAIDARILATREGRLPETAGADLAATLRTALNEQSDKFAQALQAIASGQNNRTNMMAELKGFAEIVGITKPAMVAQPASDPMQMFNMVATIMKMFKDMQPEQPLREDDIGSNSLLMKAMEVFKEVIAKGQGQQLENLQQSDQFVPVPAYPPVMAQPAPIAPETPAPIEDDEDMAMMKMQLKMMLLSAAKDAPVDTWADLIYENASDEFINELQTPDWFATLLSYKPKCSQFQPWFTKVRDAVIALLAEDNAHTAVDTNAE